MASPDWVSRVAEKAFTGARREVNGRGGEIESLLFATCGLEFQLFGSWKAIAWASEGIPGQETV